MRFWCSKSNLSWVAPALSKSPRQTPRQPSKTGQDPLVIVKILARSKVLTSVPMLNSKRAKKVKFWKSSCFKWTAFKQKRQTLTTSLKMPKTTAITLNHNLRTYQALLNNQLSLFNKPPRLVDCLTIKIRVYRIIKMSKLIKSIKMWPKLKRVTKIYIKIRPTVLYNTELKIF